MLNHPSYKPWDRWIDVVVRLLESRPPTEPCASVRAWHTLLYTCLYRRPGHRLIATAVAVLDRELFSGRLRPAESIQAATGLLAYAHFACDEGLAARVIPVLLDDCKVPEALDTVVNIGGLTVDPAARRVTGHDKEVKLGPTEFRLLHFLVTHPERVHSRAQLLDRVWGDHVFIEERTVDVHVKRLREALEPVQCARMIETVRGAGYRFSQLAATSGPAGRA